MKKKGKHTMTLRINLKTSDVLGGLTGIITGIQDRKASQQYNNEQDVKDYPHLMRVTITQDKNGTNIGQQFQIKLKKVDGFKVGQVINFDNLVLKNGKANLWANRNRFVQISLKGDELVERK